jgi:hypothetical protein
MRVLPAYMHGAVFNGIRRDEDLRHEPILTRRLAGLLQHEAIHPGEPSQWFFGVPVPLAFAPSSKGLRGLAVLCLPRVWILQLPSGLAEFLLRRLLRLFRSFRTRHDNLP